ncbi:hypothetical protein OG21DRAFT_1510224 [Imleria badia]|nr:hypothetical protein OG21DRAFT_1510224 [Imleria badia]
MGVLVHTDVGPDAFYRHPRRTQPAMHTFRDQRPSQPGGTLFDLDAHDRICVIVDGPSTMLEHHLDVQPTLTCSSEPRIVPAQFTPLSAEDSS